MFIRYEDFQIYRVDTAYYNIGDNAKYLSCTNLRSGLDDI